MKQRGEGLDNKPEKTAEVLDLSPGFAIHSPQCKPLGPLGQNIIFFSFKYNQSRNKEVKKSVSITTKSERKPGNFLDLITSTCS